MLDEPRPTQSLPWIRAASGDMTWRAGWPPSAESLWGLVEATWFAKRVCFSFETSDSAKFQMNLVKSILTRQCGCLAQLMAKEACFGEGHWSTLVSLVKNRRALTEFLSAPDNQPRADWHRREVQRWNQRQEEKAQACCWGAARRGRSWSERSCWWRCWGRTFGSRATTHAGWRKCRASCEGAGFDGWQAWEGVPPLRCLIVASAA